jgi:tetratricopeptide (TPR) repeat protein
MKTKPLLLVITAILFARLGLAQAPQSSLPPKLTPEQAETVKTQNKKAAEMNELFEQVQDLMKYNSNGLTAEALLRELLALDPTQWQYYAALGDVQRRRKKFDDAVESYEKGIHAAKANTAVDPRNPSTDPTNKRAGVAKMFFGQGRAYLSLQKNKEALTAFMKSAALDPNPAAAYFNLCAGQINSPLNSIFVRLDAEGSLVVCDKAIAADPRKADAYFIKGSLLIAGSQTDKDGKLQAPPGTVEALKKYLALAPEGAHVADVKQMLAEVGAKVAVRPKVIKDPAEYKDYITALNTTHPDERAASIEGFTRRYPQSVVLMDALEQTMEAYQQAGDGNKATETARRILAMDPNAIRALALVAAMDRVVATQGAVAPLKEGCADAETGLQQLPSWPKPEDKSDSEFGKLRDQMADIFDGMKGFCALQVKDYRAAREAYTRAFQIDPANLQDVYQLALADLEMTPVDLNGLWYCGKAMTLAQRQNNTKGLQVIGTYCRPKYRQYHGGDDGFDQMVDETAAENAPPPDFSSRIARDRTPPASEQRPSSAQQDPRSESTERTLAQSKPDAEKKDARYFVKIAANIASNVQPRDLNGFVAVYVDSQSWASGLKDGELAPFLKLKEEEAGRRCAVLFFAPAKDAAISVFFDGDSPFGVTAAKAGSSGQFEAGDISAAYKPVSKEMLKETGQEFQFNESQIVTDEGSPVVAFEVSTASKKPAKLK